MPVHSGGHWPYRGAAHAATAWFAPRSRPACCSHLPSQLAYQGIVAVGLREGSARPVRGSHPGGRACCRQRVWRRGRAAEEDGAAKRNGALVDAEDDEDAAGWDMGDDIVPEVEDGFVNVESSEAGGAGSSEADLWARNSPLAVDHVAGGSFESAMQLLNRQVGAVSFAPLKPRFLEVYQASKSYSPRRGRAAAACQLPPADH